MRLRYDERASLLILTFSLLLAILIFSTPKAAAAVPGVDVNDNQPTLNFPESLTFRATIESSAPVTSVILEYGTDQLTCGSVVAKAFPQFTPGTTVEAEWTWEMRQSGSLPPGASLWWRWRYTDESGAESASDIKTLTWLDNTHNWQTITSGLVNLHWYSGERAFAGDLLNAALAGLERLQTDAGLELEEPVHLYIYANTEDMRGAILYEPAWTGGLAFPVHDIVIIGISENELEWGRKTIAHELTHVLVGHRTFSCLGDVPTWLNEGLAVYSEGELDWYAQTQFEESIKEDQLLSIRSLSGGFSEVSSRAYLSYSQSYSIVKFMIETYGQEQMDSLLLALRDGATIDEALVQVYGFDVDGLESAWRGSVRARPRAASAGATAQPTPTFVPTYVPFAGAQVQVTPTPFIVPTSSPAQPPAQPGRPPLSLTLMLVATCCALALLFGVLGLGAFLAFERRKGESHDRGA
jgi:hypothetical protein